MNEKRFIVVIPARMASTRLPQKPLIDILGKSLIQRTYEQVLKAVPADKIVVATDSLQIQQHLESLEYNVMMTSEDCLTGTDRVAEIAKTIDVDYYINVQGDEPLINPEDISLIINKIQNSDPQERSIWGGYTAIDNEEDYYSLSIPKVVFRPDGRLLYMSRSPIPGNKQSSFQFANRQVCIYAFPKQALIEFNSQNSKTSLEQIEDIELLRFLEMGYEVQMAAMSSQSIAVDVPEDVQRVIKKLNGISGL